MSAWGALAALGSAFTWGIISLLARTLSPTFNSITINALRTTLGGALLLAWILLTGDIGKLGQVSANSLGLLTLSIILAIAVGDTIFFESSRSLGLARALTISMTYPLIATFLAVAFLGEPITLQIVGGAILTLGGLALVVFRQDDGTQVDRFGIGLGAALLASLAWAVAVNVLKGPLREIDAMTAQAIRLPMAAAVLWATPWTRGTIGKLRVSETTTRWEMIGLGALTAVSSVMFAAGVKYAEVAVATVLSSTSPLFAFPLGLLVLGERITVVAILGSVVTIAGIVVLQM